MATYGIIFHQHKQIENGLNKHDFLMSCNQGKIKAFYKKNGNFVRRLQEKYDELVELYFETDPETGQMKYTVGPDTKPRAIMKEGMTQEGFEADYKHILETPLTQSLKIPSQHPDTMKVVAKEPQPEASPQVEAISPEHKVEEDANKEG